MIRVSIDWPGCCNYAAYLQAGSIRISFVCTSRFLFSDIHNMYYNFLIFFSNFLDGEMYDMYIF